MQFLLAFLIFGALHVRKALSEQCACAKENVRVRDGAGTNNGILVHLSVGQCLTFTDVRQTDSAGASWANVVAWKYLSAWVLENYITISTKTNCSETTTGSTSTSGTPVATTGLQLPGCPTIVTRAEWGASAATSITKLTHTPKYMFIYHSASAGCHTKHDCINMVKQMQNWHMDGEGYSDIVYSFIVGEDGNVYEGRGWDRVGAHTLHYNDVGLAICVIGNFMTHPPNAAALSAIQQLTNCAHSNHKLTSNYILRGHRDTAGDKLYDIIQHWPHY